MNITLLYYCHLLLTSKYKLLMTVVIYFLIYYLNVTSSFALCMIEGSDPGSIQHLIKEQVEEFAQSAETIDIQDQVIETQKQVINVQDTLIGEQKETIQKYKKVELEFIHEQAETKQIIKGLKSQLKHLERAIHVGGTTDNPKGYKQTIFELNTQLKKVKTELSLAERLLQNFMEPQQNHGNPIVPEKK